MEIFLGIRIFFQFKKPICKLWEHSSKENDKKAMLRVVIVIPSYNSAPYIADCLLSVQKCKQLDRVAKVILMDDGSIDDTIEIARKTWSHKKAPMEIHKNDQNLGQWPNKNKAIDLIKNEFDWMFLLHSDDLVRDDWVEALFFSIQKYHGEPDLIFSECSNINIDGEIIHKDHYIESSELNIHRATANEEVKMALRRGCYWKISGSAFKLKTFPEIGNFSNKYPYAGDYYWFLTFLSYGKIVAYLPKALLINRNHTTSVAGLAHRSDTDIKEFLAILNEYLEYVNYRFLVTYHLKRLEYVIRRIFKDTTKGLFVSALHRLSTIAHIFKNLLFSISRKLKIN
jgi:glycosyltransferase involved in cell wall biosynthesis